ncbi:MAG: sulfate adenylyltransferase subunit 2 [Rickettsiales bacterium]|jgi:sulfate adenylyltransferase subunit 2
MTSRNHLKQLETESIEIIWEVYKNFKNPVILYSIGKDSSVMLHLIKKAFAPAKIPFPLAHVDTLWKFKEMIEFRDKIAKKENLELIVHTNPDGRKLNINPFDHGSAKHTDIMKTIALKQLLNKYKFDAVFGGARRDEEKSRAKERIFSTRDKNHKWDPKNQRPEFWNIYNTKINEDQSVRVFPLSNWTEMDVWQYIDQENIDIVPLYFAAKRRVTNFNNAIILSEDERTPKNLQEDSFIEEVRFRTLGCYPLTGGMESKAKNVKEIIVELEKSNESERQGRVIDSDGGGYGMEIKKKEGYF